MRTRTIALTIAVAAAMALPGVAAAHPPVDGTLHEFGEMVEYPMLFPVAKGASYTYYSDTFWAARAGGQIHHATDIMAPKMTPVIAPKAGRVHFVNWSSNTGDPYPNPERCCNLTIDFDDGWSTWFIHLNNDTPATDDGQAWGIAPGIRPGVRVAAGQLVGWVGDSGNAENTGPHLHFELRDPEGTIVNATEAFDAAPRVTAPRITALRCNGKNVTIAGTDGDDTLYGTGGRDVIHGGDGDDTLFGFGGNDIICGGNGDDTLIGGTGHDKLKGGSGRDVLEGSAGADYLRGGSSSDRLDGGIGNDRMFGDAGSDTLDGRAGSDTLDGGPGKDTLIPGSGDDVAFGGPDADRFLTGTGNDTLWGEDGNDTVDYRRASVGAVVDLGAGTGTGDGVDTLHDIESVHGSALADILIGTDEHNALRGWFGDDSLFGAGGDDTLDGGKGSDELDGGDGIDTCRRGFRINCETVPA